MSWENRDFEFEQLLTDGSELSILIDCPVRYPAYNKDLFECKGGCVIPRYLLKAGMTEEILTLHENGCRHEKQPG